MKFVIASREDYAWARDIVRIGELGRRAEILFSPIVPSPGMPGTVPGVDPRWLAESILEDRLPVRFQLQLHKIVWGAERTGV